MAPHGPQGEDQNASTGVEIPTLYILTIPPSHAATLAALLFLIPPPGTLLPCGLCMRSSRC